MKKVAKFVLPLFLLILSALPLHVMAGPPKAPPTLPKAAPLPKVTPPSTPQKFKPPALPDSIRNLSPEVLAEIANKRYLDPTTASQLYKQRMIEAKRQFPNLFGQSPHDHHVIPKFLGGPESGKTVKIDPAYHQLITNAFREEFPYKQPYPPVKRLLEILETIYSRYPLPGVHF